MVSLITSLVRDRAPTVLAAAPVDVVVWTGAGVSVDPPTCAPTGRELVTRVFEHAFAPGTLGAILRAYADLGIDRSLPRLEAALDVVRRALGLPVLADLLSDLRDPPPNELHRFFAAHLAAGGRHITANFDPCIEAAASAGPPPSVFHFHGSLADDPDGDELGATLGRIDRGLRPEIAQRMTDLLTATPRPVLVVAGYSWSDFFDIDPYLRTLAAERLLAGAVVLWIDHLADAPPAMLSDVRAAATRRQLDWLRRGGADVHVLQAPTRVALAALASAWRMTPHPARPHDRRAPWRQAVPVGYEGRRRSSLELFHLMGLHRDVARLRSPMPGGPAEWDIAARSAWAAGRYREAAQCWRRAHAGDDVAASIMRTERQGACEWVRGRYLRAYRTLKTAFAQASALPPDAVGLELRVRVAETLGRVLVHMRRSPDTRLFSTGVRRRWVLAQLPDTDTLERSLGTHLSAQVRSVRADLRDDPESGRWMAAQEAFGEYESLNAQLNYRHAELRHTAEAGNVDVCGLRKLRKDFQTIGADGDAARVPLVRGAEAAFTLTQVVRGLWRIDMTTWHRCRLLAAFAIRRAAHRLRTAAHLGD